MRPSTPLLDISALAKKAGMSSRTIRYYGERGLLKAEERGNGGRRLYGQDALERLRFIQRLKHLGLTLNEIGRLNLAFDRGQTPAMLDDLSNLLQARRAEVTTRIQELHQLDQELKDYQARIAQKGQGPTSS
mgnify:CR=1 FL=1